jgi:ferredoxin
LDKRYKKWVKISREVCDLCGTCVGVCPENVIRLSEYFLSIDHEGCTRCSKCIWVCPVSALHLTDVQELIPTEKL